MEQTWKFCSFYEKFTFFQYLFLLHILWLLFLYTSNGEWNYCELIFEWVTPDFNEGEIRNFVSSWIFLTFYKYSYIWSRVWKERRSKISKRNSTDEKTNLFSFLEGMFYRAILDWKGGPSFQRVLFPIFDRHGLIFQHVEDKGWPVSTIELGYFSNSA